ncbi:MAG: RagB/SusD family nutrient uptake outer membrane protein [Fulvivirga sp.]|nr:RagB/SusD family nutrient uptake outer membrane protein [Fulvivirga sp.]
MKNLSLRQCTISMAGLLLVIFLTSCEDNFLEPVPQTFESTQNFFESNDQFIQAVDGAYARMQEWVLQAHILEEMRSDNTTHDQQLTKGVTRSLARPDWFIMDAAEPELENAWDAIYTGIKDANVPLSEIENGIETGNLDQELGRRLEGELKFLRAFFYFTAVRFWGDVPLLLEPLTGGLQAFETEQSPKSEVFETIISDLTEAEAALPENYTGSNLGRATRGAAKTLLAKVYLRRGNYAEAEQKLREVINSNQYSLLQNYADIFDPQNKYHSESIFEVSFKQGDEGESSNFLYQFAPVGSFPEIVPVEVGSWGRNLPTRQLVAAYEEDDIRKEVSIGFFDRFDIDQVPYITKWSEATDQNFARQNHNWPLLRYADVLLMLAETINEQGYDTGQPFDLLNQIRTRAGLSSLTPTDLPDQEAFRNALLHERRVELAFENHRWHDLVRFEMAVEKMNAHGKLLKENPPTPFTSVNPLDPNAYNVESFMILYPIPENELLTNPNMVQNAGY